MSEISKLKFRLQNVGKHVIEYKMTIVEAKALAAEIDELAKKQIVIEKPTIAPEVTRGILDGGTF